MRQRAPTALDLGREARRTVKRGGLEAGAPQRRLGFRDGVEMKMHRPAHEARQQQPENPDLSILDRREMQVGDVAASREAVEYLGEPPPDPVDSVAGHVAQQTL